MILVHSAPLFLKNTMVDLHVKFGTYVYKAST